MKPGDLERLQASSDELAGWLSDSESLMTRKEASYFKQKVKTYTGSEAPPLGSAHGSAPTPKGGTFIAGRRK